jgi:hypothetical protein
MAIRAALLFACAAAPAAAVEHVVVAAKKGAGERTLSGEVIIEAQNGVILRTPDNGFHRLLGPSIRERSRDADPLVLLDKNQLAEQLLEELPQGFRVHHSTHYVVCYNTTRVYAQWTSTLLEKLQKSFFAQWKKQGLKVSPPKYPLPVIVFSDQASYAEWSKADLGPAVNNVIGYYNLDTNRITMYDLTGMQAIRAEGTPRGSMRDINLLLSTPAAEPLVATIVHEATHQISFNCGVQTRLVDNPLWMSEGLAVYFERPDLGVNYPRWDRFLDSLDAGTAPPLTRLVADDEMFRHPETAVDSYAQAWAWNYFFIKWRPKEYAAYLKDVASQEPLSQPIPKVRLAMFRKHFGSDFAALEDEFFRQMRRIEN